MTHPEDTKAERKVAAAAAGATGTRATYEETAFGRQRIRTVPKSLVTLGRLIAAPFVLLSRRVRRPRGGRKR